MRVVNIVISNRGQLQIADFGIANRARDREAAKIPYTTLVVTRVEETPEFTLQCRRYIHMGCLLMERCWSEGHSGGQVGFYCGQG